MNTLCSKITGDRTTQPISVLIVDDDELQRLSLRLSLSTADQLNVVGEAVDGPSAVEAAKAHNPTVVLMDISLPGFDGIEATSRVKKCTDAKVLILSAHDRESSVFASFRAGADGYCLKESTKEQIVAAILAVANDGTWLSDNIANAVISQLAALDPQAGSGQPGLTEFETKILNMVLEGASLEGIASDLGLNENRIYAHSQNLILKLSNSRAESLSSEDLWNTKIGADHTLARICPKCHASWPANRRNCLYDGTATKVDNLIGTIFADRYEILSVLGSGNGGTVYKARHRFMLKLVAIKVMHSNNLKRLQNLQRFRGEAIASSFLTHKNIVNVLDFGVTDKGLAFMIMEHYDAETLSKMIEVNGRLTTEQALPIFKQICDGLEHAHRAGIVHRDLKPSNILVRELEDDIPEVHILDFGTAEIQREVHGLEKPKFEPGYAFGSPAYMSPEQCRGLKLGPCSDIYSLGCLMYDVLTGTPPIVAESINDALMHQIFKEPIHINATKYGAEVPKMMQGIVMKALRKEPAMRYQSAAEMRSYLDAVQP